MILKKLIRLMEQQELDAWFNLLWGKSKEEITKEAEAKLAVLERNGRSRPTASD